MKKLPPPSSSTPPMIAAHLMVGSSCFVYPRGRSSPPSSPLSPLSRAAPLERRVDADEADGRPLTGFERRELDDDELDELDGRDVDALPLARVDDGGRMPEPDALLFAAGVPCFEPVAGCTAGAGVEAGFAGVLAAAAAAGAGGGAGGGGAVGAGAPRAQNEV